MKLTRSYIGLLGQQLDQITTLNRKREVLLKELIESVRAKIAGVHYKGRYIKTITAKDIGKYDPLLCNAIGPTRRCDIGKQVFEVDGIYSVESNEQRDRRLDHEQSPERS